jgi:hypothetical protein
VTAETFTPTVYAVFFSDAAAYHKFVVAAHADVVVACVAFETMVACVRRWDRVSADVAKGGKGQGAEDGVRNGEVARTAHE